MDAEFIADCTVWLWFLRNAHNWNICRPMVDLNRELSSLDIGFYSDASKSKMKGAGCVLKNRWLFCQWEPNYIERFDPSIQYLELYALCLGIFTWADRIKNCRAIIYCDNDAVKNMINNTTSGCKQSMYLIRLLVLNNLRYNRRIFVRHIKTDKNTLADALSRLEFDRFWRNAPEDMNPQNDELSRELWPASKQWQF